MCIGGGSTTPPAAAPPPAPPVPAPVTTKRLKSKSSGKGRRKGTARSGLVIKRTTGVQYTGSGTGVSV